MSSIVVALIALTFSMQAVADLEETLISDGWDEIEFEEKETNIFTSRNDVLGLAREIQVNSENSVSIAFLNVDIDLENTPFLEWSWQSLTPIIDTDTTIKGGDDRTLAIYVAFPYQPEQASFNDKLRRTAVELLNGPDTPDRILTYVWGGGAAIGEKVQNPYAGQNGQFIYLRTPQDDINTWFNERVNVKADFKEAFGFDPVSPVYIGIGSDTDDTNAAVKARVRNLRFAE